jgi:hypothetical protein
MEPLDPSVKINLHNQTKYRPREMTDDSVFELAQHYYTLEEIADFFNVSGDTVLNHHGSAFREGKNNAKKKPRMILNKIMDEFLVKESLTNPVLMDDGNGGLKLLMPDLSGIKGILELHAKKYEGLGSKQTIIHEGSLAYDKVESKPIILERPDTE